MLTILKTIYNFLTNNMVKILTVLTNLAAMTPTEKDDKAVEFVDNLYKRLDGKKDKK